ncbi:MAG: hypothetical protein HRU38_18820 [Saccharospirillaceae bacterium]|nr:DUF6436 domain-containing protein [Pseudomonadales bacterium]NRB80688.1 hypothetical protein [Saccharospirillaceae bacterium]
MRKKLILSIVAILCLSLFLSANILLENILIKPFATDAQLEQLLSNQHVSNQTFQKISKQQRTLVHVTQSFCICNAYSSTHIQTLNTLAQNQSIKVIDVVLDSLSKNQQHEQWQRLIALVPSTPATILLNSNGKIEYIGPYSSGLTCNSGNSFIERFLTQPQGDLPIANWINTGCYCSTQK